MTNIFCSYEEIRSNLKNNIFDQDEAIDVFVDSLTCNSFVSRSSPPPATVFLLLGESACGKKFMTFQIAQSLKTGYKIFHMAEFTREDDFDELLEALLLSLKQNPSSLVVFNEIEKSNNNVQVKLTRFLKNLDNAAVVEKTIFIFISTLGKSLYQSKDFNETFLKSPVSVAPFMYDLISKEKKLYQDQLVDTISPSILNILYEYSYLVILKRLKFCTFLKIAHNRLILDLPKYEKNIGFKLIVEELDVIVSLILLSFVPCLNASRSNLKVSDVLLQVIVKKMKTKFYSVVKIILGKKIIQFHEQASKDFDGVVRKLERSREHLVLQWNYVEENDILVAMLEDAVFHPLNLNTAIQSVEPVVSYSSIGFDYIAGQQTVKNSLHHIINLMKHPELLTKFGIERPKGVVLYGPPGVGKSILAQSFAFEADLPSIRLSGLDLFDSELIRVVYAKARESAPCIVILDDIDTKGYVSGVVSAVPSHYISSCFNLGDVFTVATARAMDDIPEEIIAPGSLDMMIEVGELDKDSRRFFIEKIFEKPHDPNIDIDKVATYMTGMNGYDLQRIGTQSALSAIIQGSEVITEVMLVEQINKIKYGEKIEPKRIRNPEEEMRMTAYHEAGHAVLSLMLLPNIKIEQVTVAPRSEVLGFVSYKDEDFITTATKDEIFKNLCVLMAGRVVKVKKFGVKGMDSGDVADIGQATLEAYAAIAHLGMDEDLGYINILALNESVASGFLKEKIEHRVLAWLNEAKVDTETLVEKYWDIVDLVAQKLIVKEMLSGEELNKIVQEFKLHT